MDVLARPLSLVGLQLHTKVATACVVVKQNKSKSHRSLLQPVSARRTTLLDMRRMSSASTESSGQELHGEFAIGARQPLESRNHGGCGVWV